MSLVWQKKFRFATRLIAFGLIISLSWTSVSFSAPAVSPAPLLPSLNLAASISIPDELGKIEEVFLPDENREQSTENRKGDSVLSASFSVLNPFIVYIQDAHANLEAQENTQKILRLLSQKLDIHTILTEGASGEADLASIRAFPNEKAKELAVKFWLKEVVLTGIEAEAILSPKPYRLIGIEDKKLYDANGKDFLEVSERQKETLPAIRAALRANREQREKVYNAELWRFEDKAARHELRDELIQLVSYLWNAGRDKGVKRADLVHVEKLISLILLEQSMRGDGGSEPLRGSPKGRRSNDSSEEKAEFEKLSREIGVKELFEEISTLKDRIRDRLFASPAERKLHEESQYFKSLEKVLSLQATPEDFDFYEKNKKNIKRFLNRARREQACLFPTIANAVDAAERFYQSSREREDAFLKNIMAYGDRSYLASESSRPVPSGTARTNLDFANPDSKGTRPVPIRTSPDRDNHAFLFTGGFHTDDLTAHFRKAKIPFILITPKISPDTDYKRYYARMKGEKLDFEAFKSKLSEFVKSSSRLAPLTVFNPEKLGQVAESFRAAEGMLAEKNLGRISVNGVSSSIGAVRSRTTQTTPQKVTSERPTFAVETWLSHPSLVLGGKINTATIANNTMNRIPPLLTTLLYFTKTSLARVKGTMTFVMSRIVREMISRLASVKKLCISPLYFLGEIIIELLKSQEFYAVTPILALANFPWKVRDLSFGLSRNQGRAIKSARAELRSHGALEHLRRAAEQQPNALDAFEALSKQSKWKGLEWLLDDVVSQGQATIMLLKVIFCLSFVENRIAFARKLDEKAREKAFFDAYYGEGRDVADAVNRAQQGKAPLKDHDKIGNPLRANIAETLLKFTGEKIDLNQEPDPLELIGAPVIDFEATYSSSPDEILETVLWEAAAFHGMDSIEGLHAKAARVGNKWFYGDLDQLKQQLQSEKELAVGDRIQVVYSRAELRQDREGSGRSPSPRSAARAELRENLDPDIMKTFGKDPKSVFFNLPDVALEDIAIHAIQVPTPENGAPFITEGQRVESLGDNDPAIFIVTRGKVKAATRGHSFEISKTPNVYGEIAFFTRQGERTATVSAASDDLELYAISKGTLVDLMKKYPYLQFILAGLADDRMAETQKIRQEIVQKLANQPGKAEEAWEGAFLNLGSLTLMLEWDETNAVYAAPELFRRFIGVYLNPAATDQERNILRGHAVYMAYRLLGPQGLLNEDVAGAVTVAWREFHDQHPELSPREREAGHALFNNMVQFELSGEARQSVDAERFSHIQSSWKSYIHSTQFDILWLTPRSELRTTSYETAVGSFQFDLKEAFEILGTMMNVAELEWSQAEILKEADHLLQRVQVEGLDAVSLGVKSFKDRFNELIASVDGRETTMQDWPGKLVFAQHITSALEHFDEMLTAASRESSKDREDLAARDSTEKSLIRGIKEETNPFELRRGIFHLMTYRSSVSAFAIADIIAKRKNKPFYFGSGKEFGIAGAGGIVSMYAMISVGSIFAADSAGVSMGTVSSFAVRLITTLFAISVPFFAQALSMKILSALWKDRVKQIHDWARSHRLTTERKLFGELTEVLKTPEELTPGERNRWDTYFDNLTPSRELVVKVIQEIVGLLQNRPSTRYVSDLSAISVAGLIVKAGYQIALLFLPDIADDEAKAILGLRTSAEDVRKRANAEIEQPTQRLTEILQDLGLTAEPRSELRRHADLEGQVSIVFGGVRNMGHAFAKKFKEAGASLVITGRNRQQLRNAAGEIGARYVRADVLRPNDVRKVLQGVAEREGRVDDVIVNPGEVGRFATLSEVEMKGPGQFQQLMRTNFLGAWMIIRNAVHEILRNKPDGQGRRGRITTISTSYAVRHYIYRLNYTLPKAMMRSLAPLLAEELNRHGISLVDVAPSLVKGPRMDLVIKNNILAHGAFHKGVQFIDQEFDALMAGDIGRWSREGNEEVLKIISELEARPNDIPKDIMKPVAWIWFMLKRPLCAIDERKELTEPLKTKAKRLVAWAKSQIPELPPTNENIADWVLTMTKHHAFHSGQSIEYSNLPPDVTDFIDGEMKKINGIHYFDQEKLRQGTVLIALADLTDEHVAQIERLTGALRDQGAKGVKIVVPGFPSRPSGFRRRFEQFQRSDFKVVLQNVRNVTDEKNVIKLFEGENDFVGAIYVSGSPTESEQFLNFNFDRESDQENRLKSLRFVNRYSVRPVLFAREAARKLSADGSVAFIGPRSNGRESKLAREALLQIHRLAESERFFGFNTPSFHIIDPLGIQIDPSDDILTQVIRQTIPHDAQRERAKEMLRRAFEAKTDTVIPITTGTLPHPKMVALDFDGVIVKERDYFEKAWAVVVRRLFKGEPNATIDDINDDDLQMGSSFRRETRGQPLVERMKELLIRAGSQTNQRTKFAEPEQLSLLLYELVAKQVEKDYADDKSSYFEPGAKELISLLRGLSLPTVVVSAYLRSYLNWIANWLDMGEDLSALEGYPLESQPPVTKVTILRQQAKYHSINPGEILFIADAYSDIQFGREAHVTTVGIAGSLENGIRLIDEGADVIATSVRALGKKQELFSSGKSPFETHEWNSLLEKLASCRSLSANEMSTLVKLTLLDRKQREVFGVTSANAEAVLKEKIALFQRTFPKFLKLKAELNIPESMTEMYWSIYIPLSLWIYQRKLAKRPDEAYILGVNGGLGIGKTTRTKILKLVLEEILKERNEKVVVFSIDDLYKRKKDREPLVQKGYRFRGPPGTHDVQLGVQLFKALRATTHGSRVEIPVFDKAIDDRSGDVRVVEGKVGIVLFEGWMVGANADVNPKQVPSGFKREVAKALREYQLLNDELDDLLVRSLRSLDAIKWMYRNQVQRQRQSVIAAGRPWLGLRDEEINRFVEYFYVDSWDYDHTSPEPRVEDSSIIVVTDDRRAIVEMYLGGRSELRSKLPVSTEIPPALAGRTASFYQIPIETPEPSSAGTGRVGIGRIVRAELRSPDRPDLGGALEPLGSKRQNRPDSGRSPSPRSTARAELRLIPTESTTAAASRASRVSSELRQNRAGSGRSPSPRSAARAELRMPEESQISVRDAGSFRFNYWRQERLRREIEHQEARVKQRKSLFWRDWKTHTSDAAALFSVLAVSVWIVYGMYYLETGGGDVNWPAGIVQLLAIGIALILGAFFPWSFRKEHLLMKEDEHLKHVLAAELKRVKLDPNVRVNQYRAVSENFNRYPRFFSPGQLLRLTVHPDNGDPVSHFRSFEIWFRPHKGDEDDNHLLCDLWEFDKNGEMRRLETYNLSLSVNGTKKLDPIYLEKIEGKEISHLAFIIRDGRVGVINHLKRPVTVEYLNSMGRSELRSKADAFDTPLRTRRSELRGRRPKPVVVVQEAHDARLLPVIAAAKTAVDAEDTPAYGALKDLYLGRLKSLLERPDVQRVKISKPEDVRIHDWIVTPDGDLCRLHNLGRDRSGSGSIIFSLKSFAGGGSIHGVEERGIKGEEYYVLRFDSPLATPNSQPEGPVGTEPAQKSELRSRTYGNFKLFQTLADRGEQAVVVLGHLPVILGLFHPALFSGSYSGSILPLGNVVYQVSQVPDRFARFAVSIFRKGNFVPHASLELAAEPAGVDEFFGLSLISAPVLTVPAQVVPTLLIQRTIPKNLETEEIAVLIRHRSELRSQDRGLFGERKELEITAGASSSARGSSRFQYRPGREAPIPLSLSASVWRYPCYGLAPLMGALPFPSIDSGKTRMAATVRMSAMMTSVILTFGGNSVKNLLANPAATIMVTTLSSIFPNSNLLSGVSILGFFIAAILPQNLRLGNINMILDEYKKEPETENTQLLQGVSLRREGEASFRPEIARDDGNSRSELRESSDVRSQRSEVRRKEEPPALSKSQRFASRSEAVGTRRSELRTGDGLQAEKGATTLTAEEQAEAEKKRVLEALKKVFEIRPDNPTFGHLKQLVDGITTHFNDLDPKTLPEILKWLKPHIEKLNTADSLTKGLIENFQSAQQKYDKKFKAQPAVIASPEPSDKAGAVPEKPTEPDTPAQPAAGNEDEKIEPPEPEKTDEPTAQAEAEKRRQELADKMKALFEEWVTWIVNGLGSGQAYVTDPDAVFHVKREEDHLVFDRSRWARSGATSFVIDFKKVGWNPLALMRALIQEMNRKHQMCSVSLMLYLQDKAQELESRMKELGIPVADVEEEPDLDDGSAESQALRVSKYFVDATEKIALQKGSSHEAFRRWFQGLIDASKLRFLAGRKEIYIMPGTFDLYYGDGKTNVLTPFVHSQEDEILRALGISDRNDADLVKGKLEELRGRLFLAFEFVKENGNGGAKIRPLGFVHTPVVVDYDSLDGPHKKFIIGDDGFPVLCTPATLHPDTVERGLEHKPGEGLKFHPITGAPIDQVKDEYKILSLYDAARLFGPFKALRGRELAAKKQGQDRWQFAWDRLADMLGVVRELPVKDRDRILEELRPALSVIANADAFARGSGTWFTSEYARSMASRLKAEQELNRLRDGDQGYIATGIGFAQWLQHVGVLSRAELLQIETALKTISDGEEAVYNEFLGLLDKVGSDVLLGKISSDITMSDVHAGIQRFGNRLYPSRLESIYGWLRLQGVKVDLPARQKGENYEEKCAQLLAVLQDDAIWNPIRKEQGAVDGNGGVSLEEMKDKPFWSWRVQLIEMILSTTDVYARQNLIQQNQPEIERWLAPVLANPERKGRRQFVTRMVRDLLREQGSVASDYDISGNLFPGYYWKMQSRREEFGYEWLYDWLGAIGSKLLPHEFIDHVLTHFPKDELLWDLFSYHKIEVLYDFRKEYPALKDLSTEKVLPLAFLLESLRENEDGKSWKSIQKLARRLRFDAEGNVLLKLSWWKRMVGKCLDLDNADEHHNYSMSGCSTLLIFLSTGILAYLLGHPAGGAVVILATYIGGGLAGDFWDKNMARYQDLLRKRYHWETTKKRKATLEAIAKLLLRTNELPPWVQDSVRQLGGETTSAEDQTAPAGENAEGRSELRDPSFASRVSGFRLDEKPKTRNAKPGIRSELRARPFSRGGHTAGQSRKHNDNAFTQHVTFSVQEGDVLVLLHQGRLKPEFISLRFDKIEFPPEGDRGRSVPLATVSAHGSRIIFLPKAIYQKGSRRALDGLEELWRKEEYDRKGEKRRIDGTPHFILRRSRGQFSVIGEISIRTESSEGRDGREKVAVDLKSSPGLRFFLPERQLTIHDGFSDLLGRALGLLKKDKKFLELMKEFFPGQKPADVVEHILNSVHFENEEARSKLLHFLARYVKESRDRGEVEAKAKKVQELLQYFENAVTQMIAESGRNLDLQLALEVSLVSYLERLLATNKGFSKLSKEASKAVAESLVQIAGGILIHHYAEQMEHAEEILDLHGRETIEELFEAVRHAEVAGMYLNQLKSLKRHYLKAYSYQNEELDLGHDWSRIGSHAKRILQAQKATLGLMDWERLEMLEERGKKERNFRYKEVLKEQGPMAFNTVLRLVTFYLAEYEPDYLAFEWLTKIVNVRLHKRLTKQKRGFREFAIALVLSLFGIGPRGERLGERLHNAINLAVPTGERKLVFDVIEKEILAAGPVDENSNPVPGSNFYDAYFFNRVLTKLEDEFEAHPEWNYDTRLERALKYYDSLFDTALFRELFQNPDALEEDPLPPGHAEHNPFPQKDPRLALLLIYWSDAINFPELQGLHKAIGGLIGKDALKLLVSANLAQSREAIRQILFEDARLKHLHGSQREILRLLLHHLGLISGGDLFPDIANKLKESGRLGTPGKRPVVVLYGRHHPLEPTDGIIRPLREEADRMFEAGQNPEVFYSRWPSHYSPVEEGLAVNRGIIKMARKLAAGERILGHRFSADAQTRFGRILLDLRRDIETFRAKDRNGKGLRKIHFEIASGTHGEVGEIMQKYRKKILEHRLFLESLKELTAEERTVIATPGTKTTSRDWKIVLKQARRQQELEDEFQDMMYQLVSNVAVEIKGQAAFPTPSGEKVMQALFDEFPDIPAIIDVHLTPMAQYGYQANRDEINLVLTQNAREHFGKIPVQQLPWTEVSAETLRSPIDQLARREQFDRAMPAIFYHHAVQSSQIHPLPRDVFYDALFGVFALDYAIVYHHQREEEAAAGKISHDPSGIYDHLLRLTLSKEEEQKIRGSVENIVSQVVLKVRNERAVQVAAPSGHTTGSERSELRGETRGATGQPGDLTPGQRAFLKTLQKLRNEDLAELWAKDPVMTREKEVRIGAKSDNVKLVVRLGQNLPVRVTRRDALIPAGNEFFQITFMARPVQRLHLNGHLFTWEKEGDHLLLRSKHHGRSYRIPAVFQEKMIEVKLSDLISVSKRLDIGLFVIANKLPGTISSEKPDPNQPQTPIVTELLPEEFRPHLRLVGRLDQDTTGLLLFGGPPTPFHIVLLNKTDFPEASVPKTYEVTVKGHLTEASVRRLLEEGVLIPHHVKGRRKGSKTVKAKSLLILEEIASSNETRLQMVITEGLHHQIRLMMEEVGNPVRHIHRIAFGEIKLGDLKPGEWRELTDEEYAWLETIFEKVRPRLRLADPVQKTAFGPAVGISKSTTGDGGSDQRSELRIALKRDGLRINEAGTANDGASTISSRILPKQEELRINEAGTANGDAFSTSQTNRALLRLRRVTKQTQGSQSLHLPPDGGLIGFAHHANTNNSTKLEPSAILNQAGNDAKKPVTTPAPSTISDIRKKLVATPSPRYGSNMSEVVPGKLRKVNENMQNFNLLGNTKGKIVVSLSDLETNLGLREAVSEAIRRDPESGVEIVILAEKYLTGNDAEPAVERLFPGLDLFGKQSGKRSRISLYARAELGVARELSPDQAYRILVDRLRREEGVVSSGFTSRVVAIAERSVLERLRQRVAKMETASSRELIQAAELLVSINDETNYLRFADESGIVVPTDELLDRLTNFNLARVELAIKA